MTIPQLSKKTHSSQNWRNPKYFKNKKLLTKNRQSSGNLSITKRYKPAKQRWSKPVRKILSFIIPLFIIAVLIGGIVLLASMAWISRDLPSPDGVINRSITVSTKIYDREGKVVLYDIHGDIKRTLIDLEKIPTHVINATLAAEDRTFFEHKGFSITGIARSVIKNIFTGSRVGGSTLTQQFVKNAILTNEKTYSRKIKELFISYSLEKKFAKNEILQMYFNEIPYGSVVYGIEAASEAFFGKSVTELTIAEGAIIASIPKAPTFYSPYGNNRDRLIVRQKYIIDSMVELGYISETEAQKAKTEKINFKPLKDNIIAPHFVMYIKEILSEKYGETFITEEGLKVYTSLDLEKQKIAEDAIKEGIENNGERFEFTNASLVAIDPHTGQILAMVGSADYFNDEIDGQVNVALRMRQPGSSLKPIIYTAAFIKGYTPTTILYDVVTDFDANENKEYAPKNYDLEEHGPVTIRKALAGSLNIPAVKATYLTGIDEILELTKDLGYTTLEDRDRFGLSLVLGGGEVKLLEHVGAYTVLAQNGVKHEINPIIKIEDKNGRVLYEYKDKKKKVIEPEIAHLTNNILSDDNARAYVFGTGSKLTLVNRQVAAKTGTTNDYRDAWTIGYTPDLVTGVWVGNNDNTKMKDGASGGTVAAPIWNKFMTEALKDTSPKDFDQLEEIKTGKPVLDGQEAAEIKIKIDTMSGKLATQYTPESTTKELAIKDAHNILHYLDKDDPRGDLSDNPQDDPQYENWEGAILKWIEDQGYDVNQNQEIPTEYDDIHKKEDQPNLIIITPLPNQTINENNFNIEITSQARREIKEVEYYIDNDLITSRYNTNDVSLNVSDYINGYHTLTVKAKDDLENTATQSIELNLLLPQVTPTLSWIDIENNSEIVLPLNLTGVLTNWERIKKIDFYIIKEGESLEQYITYLEPNQNNINFILDKELKTGNYIIFGNMFDIHSKKYKTAELKITI